MKKFVAVFLFALLFSVACFGQASFANIKRGYGSPESAIYGIVGDLYLRQDGGVATTFYVKESGAGTNTGWIAYNGAINGVAVTGTPSTGQEIVATSATAATWQTVLAPHSFSATIGNMGGTTVITTGDTFTYKPNGPLSGTITEVDVVGYAASLATCSITVDVWKKNAATPTVSDKISASAPAALSSASVALGTLNISTWTKGVAANDIWNFSVASVTGCVGVSVTVWYK